MGSDWSIRRQVQGLVRAEAQRFRVFSIFTRASQEVFVTRKPNLSAPCASHALLRIMRTQALLVLLNNIVADAGKCTIIILLLLEKQNLTTTNIVLAVVVRQSCELRV
jgi:hypothetical protein